MTLVDETLLASVRQERCCWCGCSGPSEAAHIFARGMGGGGRIDAPWNVVPLCHQDHQDHHAGRRPSRVDLLAIAAQRCDVLQGDIEAAVYCLRRVPNRTTESQTRAAMAGLELSARKLVRAILSQRKAAG